MNWPEAVLVLLAGVAAGGINTIVGAGTLVTFPTLIAFGVPPVVANISNGIGMIPGGISGTWGYRRELHGQGRRLVRLAPASLVGASVGAVLLLLLPSAVFGAAVPALLALSLLLVLFQPRMQRRFRRDVKEDGQPSTARRATVLLGAGIFGAGVYGGYFGAAQGVILIALLGVMVPQNLQRNNALKNALSLVVNVTASVTHLVTALHYVDWAIVGLIAIGTLVGGVLGAKFGRLLHPTALRFLVAVVACAGVLHFMNA